MGVPQMDLRAGQTVTLKRTFCQADFERFASLSGDHNPIHVDPEFSARTHFGKTVAHGMLLYSAIWSALCAHFPGAVQSQQQLMFPYPTFAGEEVTISLRVIEVQPQERWARVETLVIKPNGERGCQGETLLRWPEP